MTPLNYDILLRFRIIVYPVPADIENPTSR